MEEKKYLKRKEKAFTEGNQDSLASACNNLGDFYNQHGKYHEAVKEYEQEASIYIKLGKKLEMAKAHRMAGEMFMLVCEFSNALHHINIYLKTVKKLKSKVEEQRAYATLGRAHLLQGQSATDSSAARAPLKNAEKAFIHSLLISKELSGQITKLEQLDMQARLYLNIGVVKEHMDEFEESINYIEKAIKISKTHEIFELLHLCYVSMSMLYQYKKNDSTLALRYCNLALEVAKRLPNKVKKICETLIAKSEILIKEGDFSSAKQILTKAYKKNSPDENDRATIERSLRVVVKICQTLDELVTTSSDDYAERKKLFERLGDGCCHLQNYPKAIEYYSQMLECAQLNKETGKDLIPIYVSLYQTYKDDKQYEKALEFLWKEFELNKEVPAEAFSTLCSIAEVCELQMQSFWTIQDVYQKALDLAKKANNASLEKIAFARLKKVHVKFKMNTLAEQLEEDAKERGIDLDSIDDESDSEGGATEHNTPEMGDDVCLEDLTDSDSSDLDETEKPRPHRKRGTCLTIKRNNKGETQLHQACIAGNLELVRRLIEQGHVVNVRDHAGWLPLHEACNHGFRDIVELLLDKGALSAINDKGGTSCDGITPLYDACTNGFLDVVELLLERGANAIVKTDYGDTCLGALDKWKEKNDLNAGELAQYASIRQILSEKLSKAGICVEPVPLTNSNRSGKQRSGSSNNRSRDNHDLSAPALEEVDEDHQSSSNYDRQKCTQSPLKSSSARNDYRSGMEHLNCTKSPHKSSSARHEYRSVMENLKRPQRLHMSSQDEEPVSQKKRPAFLEGDDVGDDWLEDDLGPEKKRRKFLNDRELPHTSRENLSDSAVSIEDQDSYRTLLEPGTRQKDAQKLRLPRTSSMCSTASSTNRRRKQQSTLFDSGFCRFRSESSISSEESSDALRPIEPDSTTPPAIVVVSPVKIVPAAPIVLSTVSFKIKVEDELLLVPVERKKLNEVNIRWLAEEASRRYYNLVGLKPVLRLKTADGFAFEENDPINVAVEQTMITAAVLEWKISPLSQRYEEMCHQLQKKVQSDIQSALEKGQVSNSIVFSDLSLTPDLTEPVFKAIFHQSNLRILDLSNNFIQNEGCKQLGKSLHTLKQLKVLNLKGNCITTAGLDNLTSCNAKLGDLEELNLSQNPLGNKSLRSLDKLTSGCTALQKLFLCQCGISNFYDFDLNFYQLIEFDVSFNSLTPECFRKLMAKLNSSRLQSLNLSFCLESGRNCPARIAEFFESGTCEKFKRIELAGCNLCDGDVLKFTQSLGKATDLEVLNLAENPSLSSVALQYVFDELRSLRKLILTNCEKVVDVWRLESYSSSKNLPNFMSLTLKETDEDSEEAQRLMTFWDGRWSGRGKVKSVGRHFVCFVNEEDVLNY